MELLKPDAISRSILTDSEVVKRVLAGEKQLFEILLRRHNQTLYRAVRSYVTPRSEVMDLMQNTYLRSFEKLYQFNHESAFSTWLVRIGINEALGYLRKRGKVLSMDAIEEEDEIKNTLRMKGQNGSDPEQDFIRRELKGIIEKAVDTLEPKYKSVYILREVEGMTTQQAAECLGISVANIKVRNHRAKSQLKEHLKELSEGQGLFEFGSSHCDQVVENVMRQIL